MKVIIGNAWPYANGSLHIGRVSSWMAGDILARYHRAKGDEVIFVSGSDCHGSPILNKAKEINKSPEELINKYHREFVRCFNKLGFSFDIFTRTDSEYHEKQVKNIIKSLYDKGFIYEKETEEFYCQKCCDTLDEFGVEDGLCNECNSKVEVRSSNNLFFKLSYFQDYIQNILDEEESWRENAIKITKRYLDGGLRDKILTREINWGIEVPVEGFEDKRVYVWIDALLAYVTASKKVIEEKGQSLENIGIMKKVEYT
ncbi:methionyl-tRNA synthetase [Clostridium perfringens]|uniref:Methionyl-tRNA synthetase n=1 Tax=Clostridium perfringens TaxID=1502 RepID=A0A2X3HXN9_CLOPF|nr:methionyl-tRNA synthetase [Clostridium perfringens]